MCLRLRGGPCYGFDLINNGLCFLISLVSLSFLCHITNRGWVTFPVTCFGHVGKRVNCLEVPRDGYQKEAALPHLSVIRERLNGIPMAYFRHTKGLNQFSWWWLPKEAGFLHFAVVAIGWDWITFSMTCFGYRKEAETLFLVIVTKKRWNCFIL